MLLFIIATRICYAQPACYALINGAPLSTNQIDKQAICTAIGFISDYIPMDGYAFQKRDWYYNGQLIKTSSDVLDKGVPLFMKYFGDNTVYCVYTLLNLTNSTLITSTTNTVSVFVKEAGLYLTKSADPVIGCPPSIILGYQLSNNMFEAAPYPPFAFQWQLPAGWTQLSATAGNAQITVQPDATNSANATAKVTLSCGVQIDRSISFNRPLPPAPEFSGFQNTVCIPGTIRYAITPVCGIVSYTYALSGSTATFVNGTQSYTTTDPFCDVVFTSTNTSFTDITVKATFTNNISTGSTTRRIQFGTPQIVVNPYSVDCNNPTVTLSVKNYTFYDYIDWYSTETGSYVGSGSSITLPVTGFYDVVAANSCGTSTSRVRVLTKPCPETSFTIAPNPVKDNLRIVATGETPETAKTAPSEVVVSLYHTATARLVKSWKIKTGQQQYNLGITGVPIGNYFVRFTINGKQVTKQIVVE